MEIPLLQFGPVAPRSVAAHHWKEPGPIHLTPTLQLLTNSDEITSQFSPHQDDQPQVSQTFLIRDMLQAPTFSCKFNYLTTVISVTSALSVMFSHQGQERLWGEETKDWVSHTRSQANCPPCLFLTKWQDPSFTLLIVFREFLSGLLKWDLTDKWWSLLLWGYSRPTCATYCREHALVGCLDSVIPGDRFQPLQFCKSESLWLLSYCCFWSTNWASCSFVLQP